MSTKKHIIPRREIEDILAGHVGAPPDFDPKVILELHGPRLRGRESILKKAADAFGQVRADMTALPKAALAMRRDAVARGATPIPGRPLGIPTDLHRPWDKASAVAYDRTRSAVDGALGALRNETGKLEDRISRAIGVSEDRRLAGEIRAYLARQKREERMRITDDAIARGDRTTIAAAVEGPHFLAGWSSEEEQLTYRARAQAVLMPDEHKALQELNALTGKLEGAWAKFDAVCSALAQDNVPSSTSSAAHAAIADLTQPAGGTN